MTKTFHSGQHALRANDFVQTRDGRVARILAVDAKNAKSVVALVLNEDSTESTHSYYPDGNFYIHSLAGPEHPLDLVSSVNSPPSLNNGE